MKPHYVYMTTRCQPCFLSKQRKEQQARRQWMNDYKTERGCVDCGYNTHPAALDFDHVRGTKKFCIGHRVKCSRKKLLPEMAKCDIVCANCHRVRTEKRRVPCK